MNDIVVYLITNTFTSDDIGQQKKTEAKAEVYATFKSIGSNEFFKAGQAGLKPSFSIVVFSAEYNGQENVEVDGKVYSVYRTYTKDDRTELYLTENIGDIVL